MNVKHRRRWRIVRSYCLGWTGAFVFLSVVRGSGTIEEGSVQFGLATAIGVSVVLGLVFGAIAGCAQIVTEERAYKRMPLRRLLLVRLLFAVLFVVALVLMSYGIVTTMFGVSIGLVAFAFEPGSFAIYFYVLSVDLFLVMVRQVDLLLGVGNLRKLLLGRFYTPREEERIFMFLDLQSSTSLAEKLGHIRYSMLIQDCFDDLGVATEHEARVYQYVGDGVILTWPLRDGLTDQNCLQAYFAFRERLASRADFYLERYGCQPVFTAGANVGAVTVTEVGKHKREIAYHGDAINTAARIQGQCKALDRDFLISASLRDGLGGGRFDFTPLGQVELRGKGAPVPVVAVEAR